MTNTSNSTPLDHRFDWRSLETSRLLSDLLAKHVVGLYVNVKGKAEDQGLLFPGFLLRVKGVMYWVTAGHVIDDLARALSDPNVKFMKWIDGFEKPGAETIPVTRNRLKQFSATEFGRDFGLFIIPPYDASLLLANPKVEPIHEKLWQGLDTFEPIGFFLLGFPNSGHRIAHIDNLSSKLKAVHQADRECLPVEWIDRSSVDINNDAIPDFWNDPEALYGRILPYSNAPDVQPSEIEGMSGGPLIGLEAPTETETHFSARYRLYAVQSRWLNRRRIIRAVPTLPFIQIIEETAREAGVE